MRVKGIPDGTAVRRLALSAAAAAMVTSLGGCAAVGDAFGGFGWPQGGITEQSARMYDLWIGSVVAALAVGLLVWGLIFWCVVRYRRRGEQLPAQTRFHLPMEVLYTVIPFLVISVLFYHTAVVQTEVQRTSPDPDVVVQVVGFKWSWQFNYRDGIGPEANTVATSTVGAGDSVPVLVVPAGKTIRFELTSPDVIHSFWVPELLFKRDVFPGSVRNPFEVTIKADQTGAYVGRCAELCGVYHYQMLFELRVVSPADFDRFLAGMQSGMSTPQALESIGEQPRAVTIEPFEIKRDRG